MRTFDGPCPVDTIYFRVAGDKQILSAPLCECFTVMNGIIYDPKQSTEAVIAFIERAENGKSYKFNRDEFRAKLTNDIYEGKQKVIDFAVQPEGEMMTSEVAAFLERYKF